MYCNLINAHFISLILPMLMIDMRSEIQLHTFKAELGMIFQLFDILPNSDTLLPMIFYSAAFQELMK